LAFFAIGDKKSYSKMSTVVSETITAMEDLRTKEKPISKLVRTSSLERIKEINNYICSHNYFFLPVLLNWIKSSQGGLESNLDIATTFYQHLLYNILLCKVIEFKLICKGCFNYTKKTFNTLLLQLASNITDSAFLFKLAIYVAVVLVSLEISTCFYLLFAKYPPGGLLFLCGGCVSSVGFLLYEGVAPFEHHRRKGNLKVKSN